MTQWNASRFALAGVLGFGLLLGASAILARDRSPATFWGPGQGQELVTGRYQCVGTTFTDGQAANVGAHAYLSATSGITDGFYGIGRSSDDVPADLAAMAQICDTHVDLVISKVPAICTLGPVESGGGVFGNGENTGVWFEFSCQGTRDQVVGVIGGFSRIALTALLP